MTYREYLATLTAEEQAKFKKDFIRENGEAVYEDILDEECKKEKKGGK